MYEKLTDAQFDGAAVGDRFVLVERSRFDRHREVVVVTTRTEHQIRVRSERFPHRDEVPIRRFSSAKFLAAITPQVEAELAQIEQVARVRSFLSRASQEMGGFGGKVRLPMEIVAGLDTLATLLEQLDQVATGRTG